MLSPLLRYWVHPPLLRSWVLSVKSSPEEVRRLRSIAAGAVFSGGPTFAEEEHTFLIVRELDTGREGDWGNLLGVRDLENDRFTSKSAGAEFRRELRAAVVSLNAMALLANGRTYCEPTVL